MGSHFGPVSGNFAMDDVRCSGGEARLEDCDHKTEDNCGGSEGAGVVCYSASGEIQSAVTGANSLSLRAGAEGWGLQ